MLNEYEGPDDERARADLAWAKSLRTESGPLFRLPMAFLEVFPFGLVVSLISAAILRNRKALPAAS